MRRISAFLMIAAMVAVLVPSAALGARPEKPPPGINQITAVSLDGTCEIEVIASWEGRAFEVQIEQLRNGFTVNAERPLANNKLGRVSVKFPAPDLATAAYTWSAVALDRKGNEIGIKRVTRIDDWEGSGCPPHSTVVASVY